MLSPSLILLSSPLSLSPLPPCPTAPAQELTERLEASLLSPPPLGSGKKLYFSRIRKISGAIFSAPKIGKQLHPVLEPCELPFCLQYGKTVLAVLLYS